MLYIDSKPVAKWIRDNLGVDDTPQGIVDLRHRIGVSYKKTREVSCECSEEKQLAFMEGLLKIPEHLDEEAVVYYADEVHPTHNLHSAYAWIVKGLDFEQLTVNVCHRVNINGLINAKDLKGLSW